MFWPGSVWSELMSGDVHHRPSLYGQDVLKDPEVGYQFRDNIYSSLDLVVGVLFLCGAAGQLVRGSK